MPYSVFSAYSDLAMIGGGALAGAAAAIASAKIAHQRGQRMLTESIWPGRPFTSTTDQDKIDAFTVKNTHISDDIGQAKDYIKEGEGNSDAEDEGKS